MRIGPRDLLISEIFGPTIQGEGPSVGRLAFFIRLAGCNLRCVWCDTRYTWDWKTYSKAEETTEYPIAAIVAEVVSERSTLAVITGGEPMLQAESLLALVLRLRENHVLVEIETAGTLPLFPPMEGVTYNVSPKPPSSLNGGREYRHEQLAAFAKRDDVIFKFVLADALDQTFVTRTLSSCGMRPERVWVMPEGRTAIEIAEASRGVVDFAIAHGVNFSTRLHVLLWGDRRGV